MDTHAVVKELMAVGFTDEQAEAVTRVVREASEIDLSSLATKEDLAPLATKIELAHAVAQLATRAELAQAVAPLATKAELAQAVAHLATKAELGETKADILKWVIGSMGIQTVVIIGALLALMRLPPH